MFTYETSNPEILKKELYITELVSAYPNLTVDAISVLVESKFGSSTNHRRICRIRKMNTADRTFHIIDLAASMAVSLMLDVLRDEISKIPKEYA